jgi:predicted AAA+ superfamily ATPase
VLIEGPKACGKTETARRQAATEVRLDTDQQSRTAIDVAPDLILNQNPPVLLDEWQVAPSLWNLVRRTVDDRNDRGQFILTGSATPLDDAARHSGAGRISVMRMRPMCLAEMQRSDSTVSLRRLLDGETQAARDPGISIAGLAEIITIGGWPGWHDQPSREASRTARDYLTQISHVDLPTIAGSRRDPQKVDILLRSLARNVSTEATIVTLSRDMSGGDKPVDRETAATYLNALERLMVVENQPAWAPALRSRSQLRSSPKRHFVDPSLAAAALRLTPQALLADLETLGLLFESLVVRDLRVLSQPVDGQVLHYRDNKGLEVDAIVTTGAGAWGAFEVKLGTSQIDSAAARLLEFASKVDTSKLGEPAALGVITGSGLAYRRADGIHVVPIGTLGP